MAEVLFQWAFHWLHGPSNQQLLRLYIKQDIIEDNMEIRGRRRGPSAPASASPQMAMIFVTVRHKGNHLEVVAESATDEASSFCILRANLRQICDVQTIACAKCHEQFASQLRGDPATLRMHS
jgi:hypothetical protein